MNHEFLYVTFQKSDYPMYLAWWEPCASKGRKAKKEKKGFVISHYYMQIKILLKSLIIVHFQKVRVFWKVDTECSLLRIPLVTSFVFLVTKKAYREISFLKIRKSPNLENLLFQNSCIRIRIILSEIPKIGKCTFFSLSFKLSTFSLPIYMSFGAKLQYLQYFEYRIVSLFSNLLKFC